MPKDSEYIYDEKGRIKGKRTVGQDEDVMAREKFDPAMQSGGKSQAEVEASGGLGALAEKMRKRKQEMTTKDAAAALAKGNK